MPTFDPDVALLLEAARKSGALPFEALAPDAARVAYAESRDRLQVPAQDVASIRNIDITGPAGPLTLRIYRPIGTQAVPTAKQHIRKLCCSSGLPARPGASFSCGHQ